MEHKFYTDDFERLLKEKSDEFRMYPSKRVWHSIYNNLHPDRKWPSITVTLILVAVLFLVGYWNNSNNTAENLLAGNTQNNKKTTAQNTSNQTTVQSTGFNNTGTQTVINTQLNNPEVIAENSLQTSQQKTSVKQLSQYTAAKNIAGFVTNTVKATKRSQFFNNSVSNKKSSSLINEATVSTAQFEPNANKQPYNVTATENLEQSNIASDLITTASNQYKAAGSNNKSDEVVIENAANKDVVTAADNINNLQQLQQNNNQVQAVAVVKKESATYSQLSEQDKSWIEHYALYNKNTRKRWKGRLNSEIYITPGAGLRSFYSNTSVKLNSGATAVNIPGAKTEMPAYNPGFTFQIGAGISYAASKTIRLKAGLQASFTSYSIPVTDINHPVLTTLTFTNPVTGYPYFESRPSVIANVPGHNNKKIHNQTSQVSIPVGAAIKLKGIGKLEWYAGGSIQPTFILGGKAYLPSSDNNNYVSDPSLLRKWNMNAAAETYINYKMSGFTLHAGPELRYQFMSTYLKTYSNTEKLYNIGIKVGIVKSL